MKNVWNAFCGVALSSVVASSALAVKISVPEGVTIHYSPNLVPSESAYYFLSHPKLPTMERIFIPPSSFVLKLPNISAAQRAQLLDIFSEIEEEQKNEYMKQREISQIEDTAFKKALASLTTEQILTLENRPADYPAPEIFVRHVRGLTNKQNAQLSQIYAEQKAAENAEKVKDLAPQFAAWKKAKRVLTAKQIDSINRIFTGGVPKGSDILKMPTLSNKQREQIRAIYAEKQTQLSKVKQPEVDSGSYVFLEDKLNKIKSVLNPAQVSALPTFDQYVQLLKAKTK